MTGEVRLGDVTKIDVGFPFKSECFSENPQDIRLLRGDNIAQGRLRWAGVKRWPIGSPYDSRYELAPGDVVLAMDRPWIEAGLKQATVRDDDLPAVLVQRVARLRGVDGKLDQGYLAAIVSSGSFSDYLVSVQTGSAVPHISGRQIAEFSLRLPPIGEQRAIAEVLGALDDKIAANTKLATTADKYARSYYSSVANELAPIRDIAHITMGTSPKGSDLNQVGDGLPFYQGVRDFGTRTPTVRVWTTTPLRVAQPGDTLLSVRAPVGRINRADERVAIGRGLSALRSTSDLPWVLQHALFAGAGAWAPFDAGGTVFSSVNRNEIAGVRVPWVSESRQRDVEARLAAIEMRIASAIAENLTLVTTRDALLPHLMSGKLPVADVEQQPHDEE